MPQKWDSRYHFYLYHLVGYPLNLIVVPGLLKNITSLLRKWKKGSNPPPKALYHRIYPTTEEVPKLYGLPKIHKAGAPLRPIVSSIGSITYNAAKVLAEILNPLVGKTPHHVKNSADFVEKIRNLEVPPVHKIISYDVSALFTSIPVDDAVRVVRRRLEADTSLNSRTPLSVDQIMELLQFCLSTTYFVYKGVYYQQTHGTAMGSPVSPIVANLYMEDFEQRALATAPHPPSVWLRYVDDTFVEILEYYAEEFFAHINSIDQNIQFTRESDTEGRLPFLDTCIHVKDDSAVKTTIYRKPTQTDQYLNFLSNHHLSHKRSVVRTLLHRVDQVVTEEDDRRAEINHVRAALTDNGYTKWALQIPRAKGPTQQQAGNKSSHKTMALVPYVQGLSEKLENIFREQGGAVAHKPFNTLRSQLVRVKDKTPDLKKCGVVYQVDCPRCDQFYLGETERTLGTRLKEHQTASDTPTAVRAHTERTGHQIQAKDISVLAREDQWHRRRIREAVLIRKHQPGLNRDDGYKLPHVYDRLLGLTSHDQGHVMT